MSTKKRIKNQKKRQRKKVVKEKKLEQEQAKKEIEEPVKKENKFVSFLKNNSTLLLLKDFFVKILDFKTPIGRREYWRTFFIVFIGFALAISIFIYYNIPLVIALLICVAFIIPIFSMFSRRYVDTGIKWYVPILFITSVIVSFSLSGYKISQLYSELETMGNASFINGLANIPEFLQTNGTMAMAVSFAFFIFILLLLAIPIFKQDFFKEKKKLKIVLTILTILIPAAYGTFITYQANSIATEVKKADETLESDYNSKIEKAEEQGMTKEVAGNYTEYFDGWETQTIIDYFENDISDDIKNSFKESYVNDDYKLIGTENIYFCSIYAVNSFENYPLIEIALYNDGESQDINLSSISIDDNTKELNSNYTLKQGMNFIPLKFEDLEALKGNELIMITTGENKLGAVLYDVDSY